MERSDEKIVLILSYNQYPNGDAGAVRDMIFAQMYNQMGYKVICFGRGGNKGVINDIEYIPAFENVESLMGKIKQSRRYIGIVKAALHKYKNRIEVIHILDIPLQLIQYLKSQKKKYNLQLVHDSVEWYSACEFKYGKLSRAYIHKDLLNRYVIDRNFKVISISTYLQDYYSKKSIKTIRIPVLMELDKIQEKKEQENSAEKQILYAGSPGKKDCLDKMLAGVMLLSKEEQQKIKFHIIGVNKNQLEQYLSKEDYEKLKDTIVVHGRKSREFVLDMLNKVDFTVLLRLNERYANAGFSTKFVESLANGVPIICNLTSDMGLYCKNGKNAICLEDATSELFCEALREYIAMQKEKIHEMSVCAYESAQKYFIPQLFIEEFKEFIGN